LVTILETQDRAFLIKRFIKAIKQNRIMGRLKKFATIIAIIASLSAGAGKALAKEDSSNLQNLSNQIQVSLKKGKVDEGKIKAFVRTIAKLKDKKIKGVNIPLNLFDAIEALNEFYNRLDSSDVLLLHKDPLYKEIWVNIFDMIDSLTIAESSANMKFDEERKALKKHIAERLAEGEKASMQKYHEHIEDSLDKIMTGFMTPEGGFKSAWKEYLKKIE